MKKVSTAPVTATKNFSQPEADDWVRPGRSIELVLPARRSGRSAAGTESEHDSESDARGVWGHAALSDRAGDGDAFALGEFDC